MTAVFISNEQLNPGDPVKRYELELENLEQAKGAATVLRKYLMSRVVITDEAGKVLTEQWSSGLDWLDAAQ